MEALGSAWTWGHLGWEGLDGADPPQHLATPSNEPCPNLLPEAEVCSLQWDTSPANCFIFGLFLPSSLPSSWRNLNVPVPSCPGAGRAVTVPGQPSAPAASPLPVIPVSDQSGISARPCSWCCLCSSTNSRNVHMGTKSGYEMRTCF